MDALWAVTFVVCVINISLSMGNIMAMTSNWGKFNKIISSYFSKTQAEYYSVFAEMCRDSIARKKKADDAVSGDNDRESQE